MRMVTVTVVVGGLLLAQTPVLGADATRVAQAPAAQTKPGMGVAEVVQVRGSVAAVDKEQGTVTLKGPKATVTLEVRDRQKLDVIKVGDPVVAAYMEALVIQVKKSGTAAPGVTTQETRVTSKPGDTPAGAIGREVSMTGTITAIDQKAHTVTIKGPKGRSETITARDPKNLEGIKKGDLVEIRYSQALAISLDKPAK